MSSKKATVHYRSLRSNLVHLPLSLYSGLVQVGTVSSRSNNRESLVKLELTVNSILQRPQSLIIHLTAQSQISETASKQAYLGWSGLSSASSLSFHQVGEGRKGMETIEMDPEVARGLGWPEGQVVSRCIPP